MIYDRLLDACYDMINVAKVEAFINKMLFVPTRLHMVKPPTLPKSIHLLNKQQGRRGSAVA